MTAAIKEKPVQGEIRSFDAEVGKVLQLMIHSLYQNKEIFLRELISNASDACDKLRYQTLNNPALLGENEKLKIQVILNPEAGTLTVRDNGIGMSKEELIQNLGTIASSGTQKFLEALEAQKDKKAVELIGQFGVGFYSSFMVADEVIVHTRKAGEAQAYFWKSNGNNNYSIGTLDEDQPCGTSIILKLKSEEADFLDSYKVERIIQTYSDHIAFPIELIADQEEAKQVNSASALWLRPKDEITQEQHEEFYRYLSHLPGKPFASMHYRIEGNIEYTSLLYIPSMKPYDLFHPDRKTNVKLYVKRVFITDEGNLIPPHLRFIKGVVDSEDLPLNISRETLQNNSIISKIRKSLSSKILAALKQKMQEDLSAYEKMWANFGEVIKEGLCEFTEEKEPILEICRFYTNKSGEAMVSLDEYIQNMAPNQEQIFYITGGTVENLKNNPKLEGFNARGIEVLLLPDHVDDFWVNVAHEYKGKKIVSLASNDVDLTKISPESSQNSQTEQKEDNDHSKLTSYIKQVLGEEIKEARASRKLVGSPACLAVPEGAMSARMEKYLIEQKQLAKPSAKILEVNPNHPLVRKIETAVQAETSDSNTENLVYIVFDQACILEGEPVKDPARAITRINELLSKAV
jgi:molecular chaperone HtpG